MVHATAPLLLVACRAESSAYHTACSTLCNRNMGVLPMAVKKLGAPADRPLRKFIIKHDKGSRNTAVKDDIVDHSKVAIKQRIDDYLMAKEIGKLSKDVWDD